MTTLDTHATAHEPTPGSYYDGLDAEVYHRGPGTSSTRLKVLAQWSPLHFRAYKPKPPTEAMLLGTVLHAMALEPETVDGRFIFAPGLKLTTKAGKERMAEIQAEALETGREVVRADVDDLRKVAAAIRGHAAWQLVTGPEPAFERSYYWTDEETGELLKCRPDALNLQYGKNGHALVVDLKSTRDPRDRAFARQVVDLGYDFSSAMYCAGVEAVTGQRCGFAWFIFEPSAPYATRVVFAGEQWLARGRALYRKALTTLAECRETDRWPGLDGGLATVLEMPRWAELEEVAR